MALKPSDVTQFLEVCVRANRPACVSGLPGIGKSDVVRQLADKLYAAQFGIVVDGNGNGRDASGKFIGRNRPYLWDVRVATLESVDLRGVPDIDRSGPQPRTVWTVPEFLPTDPDAVGIIFWDEINRGGAAIQNVCLQAILDKRIGEWNVPIGVAQLAAINPTGSGTTEMNPALRGRFVHCEQDVDLDDFCAWSIRAQQHPMVRAFHRYRITARPTEESMLCRALKRGEMAGPSPRTWEFVSDILNANPPKSIRRELIAGSVGTATADEFLPFVEMFGRIGGLIDAILLNPATALVPNEMSEMYAVVTALASKATQDNLGRVVTYLDRLPEEFNVCCMKDATRRDQSLCNTTAFVDWTVTHKL